MAKGGRIGTKLALATAASAASAGERFSVVAKGEMVRHVYATLDGPVVDLGYAVSDDGRGPKHREHLVLDANGAPVEWTIEGTLRRSGAVDERLAWKDGLERWKSQADQREVRTAAPKLYSLTARRRGRCFLGR